MYKRILNERISFPDHVTTRSRDIITRLVDKRPLQRLGAGPRGTEDVMSHPFFELIDWTSIYEKRYDPPFVPGRSFNFTEALNADVDLFR
jgi:hypothetical protein